MMPGPLPQHGGGGGGDDCTPVAKTRAGSSLHAAEGAETSAGGGRGDDLPNSRRY
jgi:hypothetical protein